jgi:predicted nucleic acid-binding protein
LIYLDASARLRTLDAIHIASAQIIGPALRTLVTYDKRMLDVARSIGLPSAAPGLHDVGDTPQS